MKVCFDVNVIVNLFARADKFVDAVIAYDVVNLREFDACVPASALADIAYILHRRGLASTQVDASLDALFDMFDIIDVNGADGRAARQSGMKDFEDALIAESCRRNGIDLILTHNIKDYRASPVVAMTPTDFMKTYKPARYHYAEVEF